MPDSMDLFSALQSGRLPSRVPVAINILDQGAQELGVTSEAYYHSAENVAEGQLRLRKKYGHDVVWGAHYTARLTEMLGSRRTLFPKIGPPNVGDMVIKTYDDIEKLVVPDDVSQHPSFEIQAETIRLLKSSLGGKAPVCAYVVGSFTLPAILMGMGPWLELFLTGPPALANHLLEKCSKFAAGVYTAFQNAGADLIAYANPCMSTDFFTLKQIERTAMYWLQKDLAQCGSEGLVYFCGGAKIGETIPLLVNHTNIGAYYLNPFDDIAAAKKAVHQKALVIAPINDILLIRHTIGEIQAAVRNIMEVGAPGGGFLLGSLVMPCEIPEQNIRAMVDAAHEFGNYAEA